MRAAIQGLWRTSGAGLVVTLCIRLHIVKCISRGDRLIAPLAFIVRAVTSRIHGRTLCHILMFVTRTSVQPLWKILRRHARDHPIARVRLSLHRGSGRTIDRVHSVAMLTATSSTHLDLDRGTSCARGSSWCAASFAHVCSDEFSPRSPLSHWLYGVVKQLTLAVPPATAIGRTA